ncbi:MAG: type IV secretory system conjugative DNA transfer family protein [Rhodospirillales bacterium]|nr:type IV secretory system conjugative DNA transfer family protein [Rhodospirillales bacterium]
MFCHDPLSQSYDDARKQLGEPDEIVQDAVEPPAKGKVERRKPVSEDGVTDALVLHFNNEQDDVPPWFEADDCVNLIVEDCLKASVNPGEPVETDKTLGCSSVALPSVEPCSYVSSGRNPYYGTSILLGYSQPDTKQQIGFTLSMKSHSSAEDEPVLYDGEGHLLTLGSTGSGKGVSCVIPTLLSYSGPVVVVDPKGEAAKLTAGYRRDILGQKTLIIDPWRLVTERTHALNPLDAVDMNNTGYYEAAQALAGLIIATDSGEQNIDPHWNTRARQIVTCLLMLIAKHFPAHLRNLEMLSRIFSLPPQEFAKLMVAADRSPVPEIARMSGQVLMAADKERSSIFSSALRGLGPWSSSFLLPAIDHSDVQMEEIIEGAPSSIFFVIPPQNLRTHGGVVSVWIGTILNALLKRTPGQNLPRTLLILDEAAQLGYLPQVPLFYSLARGFGVRVWTIWQSAAQLKTTYPADYENLIDQCHVLQAFGITNSRMAHQVAHLVGGVTPEELMEMPADQCLVLSQGFVERKPRFLKKPNYLSDTLLWARSGLSLD